MRVVLAPVGSRGDVQPTIALAHGLKAAGHHPAFSLTRDFADVVARQGFEVQAVDMDAQAVATEMGSRIHNPLHFAAKIRELLRAVEEEAFRAAEGADIVVGAGVQVLASSVCQARKVPYVYAAYSPTMLRSRLHAPVSAPWQGLSGWLNGLLWSGNNAAVNFMMRKTVNLARTRLGLPPIADVWSTMITHNHVLGAFDADLAAPQTDAGARFRATGFWFLEDPTPLEPALEAFLSSGAAPVYIGFGSMPHTRPEVLSALVMDAIARSNVRAVVGAGWAGLGTHGPVPENCYVVNSTNHSRLFGRTAGVVHHGGAGTMSTAARAGVPQLVVPHLMDQFYWAHRVHTRGLGPAPISIKRLTSEKLAAALTDLVGREAYRSAAAEVAAGLRRGDGVTQAVAEIERVAALGV